MMDFWQWAEEEEDSEFRDMFLEFGNIDDDTDEDWIGQLMCREEFEGVLDLYVDDAEEDEDWNAEFEELGNWGIEIGEIARFGAAQLLV